MARRQGLGFSNVGARGGRGRHCLPNRSVRKSTVWSISSRLYLQLPRPMCVRASPTAITELVNRSGMIRRICWQHLGAGVGQHLGRGRTAYRTAHGVDLRRSARAHKLDERGMVRYGERFTPRLASIVDRGRSGRRSQYSHQARDRDVVCHGEPAGIWTQRRRSDQDVIQVTGETSLPSITRGSQLLSSARSDAAVLFEGGANGRLPRSDR